MAQESEPTATYSASTGESTGTYQTNPQETFAYSDLRGQHGSRSKTHGIAVGDTVRLHGRDYAVEGIISEGTGEAVIYKVADDRGEPLALKLYFEFSNPKEEPNGETLRRIREIADPDILRLHDFGVGSDKYQDRYCFEVCDYARGGDLFSVEDLKSKYTPEFIERVIVSEVFKGIRQLHGHKIFHCDLKPSNIFYLDESQADVVIGDYGSAKAYDLESERDGRKTSTVKGTEVYLSPEQARGLISEKNDYYSLGMILLHLLYPESIAGSGDPRRVSKERLERIMERQYNSVPIIEFDPARLRLNRLIEGLTLINHVNRWGREEVERWLRGEEVKVRYKSAEVAPVQPVKLGYATIYTGEDFINALETHEAAYEDLVEDEDTVKPWLDTYRDVPTRKLFYQTRKFYQPVGREYVTEALIRFFEPARPIRVDMHSFDLFAAQDLRREAAAFVAKLDEVWKITKPERLRFHLFKFELALRQLRDAPGRADGPVAGALLEKLYAAFGVTEPTAGPLATRVHEAIDPADGPRAYRQFLDLFYEFDPARTYRDASGRPVAPLEQLALELARDEASFSDKMLAAERERFFKKLGRPELTKLKYTQFVFEVFKGKAESRLELVDLYFDRERNYKVSYKYYKSLSRFLLAQGIARDFTSASDRGKVYKGRRKFIGSFSGECEKFINYVCKMHNIGTLTEENLAEVRAKFRRESRLRYLYNFLSDTFRATRILSNVESLRAKEAEVRRRFPREAGLMFSILALIVTLPLLFIFSIWMGWVPADRRSQYLTLNSAVNLDGVEYEAGDRLKVISRVEYADCLEVGAATTCYPTKAAAALVRKAGDSPLYHEGIDKFGSADYEFKQSRKVFKATKSPRVFGRKHPVGTVFDVSVDDGSRWCFKSGKQEDCFPRRSSCRECSDPIDDYGYVISDYRGRRLFTFNRAATLGGLSFPKGNSWEVKSDSEWATCVGSTDSSQARCFLKAGAIKRFSQPHAPVVGDYGSYGYWKFDPGEWYFVAAILFALAVAGLAFWLGGQLARRVRLFFLRGDIATATFQSL